MKSTLNTKNINLSMQEYAKKNNISDDKVDFKILGMQSYIKTCHLESFAKLTDSYKVEYQLPDKIIKDHVRYLQIYKISIFPKEKQELNLIYHIEYGELSTYPILVLSHKSELPMAKFNQQEMIKLLYNEINKIKAKNRILINLFASMMVSDLKEFVYKIYKSGFISDASILLFEGIDPEIAQPSKVIEHYKEKLKSEKVAEVQRDELIITYIKPIYGKAGFNAYGQRVAQGDTNNKAKIEYQIDKENIITKDSATEIKYYAKNSGFVSTLKNILTISNKIVIENIKQSEGTLTKNEDNKVAVVISQTDVTKDGVGEGVELKSDSIHITGHTGANSNIEAKDVIIDGATHTQAFVTAKTATINRHKGTLRCHKAQINSLEGGTIYATHADINTALGGTICAEHVNIKSIKHNLKIYASKSITIERVLGEDNHFVIDYRKLPVLQSKLKYLQEEYDDLKWKFEDNQKHSPQKLPELQKLLDAKKDEIDEIKLSHYDAVVTVMAPINGLNTIEFAIAEKQSSLLYRTKQNKAYEPFSIKKEQDKIILEPVQISIDI